VSLLDRKNMLWEGSRMFLPEHREQLQRLRKQQNKKSVPHLAPDQIEEFNWTLQEALHNEVAIIVEYLDKEGQPQTFCGFVENVNPTQQSLLIINGQEKRNILMNCICNITIL